jgi:hypothetical protein
MALSIKFFNKYDHTNLTRSPCVPVYSTLRYSRHSHMTNIPLSLCEALCHFLKKVGVLRQNRLTLISRYLHTSISAAYEATQRVSLTLSARLSTTVSGCVAVGESGSAGLLRGSALAHLPSYCRYLVAQSPLGQYTHRKSNWMSRAARFPYDCVRQPVAFSLCPTD